MEVIYTGKEVKRLLTESIPGYKPKMGDKVSPENKKINKKSNEDSIEKTELKNIGKETKPVAYTKQNSDLGNNKNMLDLEFSFDPGKEWRKKVEKEVTGEDSISGNKPDEGSDNNSNKAFYDAAKKASSDFVDKKHTVQTTGLVSKYIPMPKKETAFKESDEKKIKKLNFKNTKFLSENHMLSLIPEDYKKDGNKFVMKDKNHSEYLIEWTSNELKSEGLILKHENKKQISEEFDRIKSLYSYKSENESGKLKNTERLHENEVIKNNVAKLRSISEI